MNLEYIKSQVREAVDSITSGLNLIIELNELQEAINNLPQNESVEQMLKEIIEKEKLSVGLLQKGTLIQRSLLKHQHDAIASLFNKLS